MRCGLLIAASVCFLGCCLQHDFGTGGPEDEPKMRYGLGWDQHALARLVVDVEPCPTQEEEQPFAR